MSCRLLTTTALLALTAASQATAGSIALETAGIAADLDNQRGTGTLAELIGTDSRFAAQDLLGDGTPKANLVFGNSSRFSEASIDARRVFADTVDVSGTSRNSNVGETFHLVALDVTLDAGESFVADAHDLGDGVNAFDRVFLSSVELFDADGNVVAPNPTLVTDSRGAPSVRFAPGAGNYRAVFSASSPSPAGDDEFRVRFSTVAGVPSPTAAAAGLLGLFAMVGRRRRNG